MGMSPGRPAFRVRTCRSHNIRRTTLEIRPEVPVEALDAWPMETTVASRTYWETVNAANNKQRRRRDCTSNGSARQEHQEHEEVTT